MAQLSIAWHGSVWHKTARHGQHSFTKPGTTQNSSLQLGTAWHRLVQPGMAQHKLTQLDAGWYSLARLSAAWHSPGQHVMPRLGAVPGVARGVPDAGAAGSAPAQTRSPPGKSPSNSGCAGASAFPRHPRGTRRPPKLAAAWGAPGAAGGAQPVGVPTRGSGTGAPGEGRVVACGRQMSPRSR